MSQQEHDITNLLNAWRTGDDDSLRMLISRVYHQLRALAHEQLQREWGPTGLDTTALVQRAFMDLLKQEQVDWQDRDHFFRVTARAMRRVLIDDARQREQLRSKQLHEAPTLQAKERDFLSQLNDDQLRTLNHALDLLAQEDQDAAHIIELELFGGFPQAEVQRILKLSERTVVTKATFAKAWLFRRIRGA